jgi:hypothetical protein
MPAQVTPATLQLLARHAGIGATMKYYVAQLRFFKSFALLNTNGSHPERSEGSPILPQILRFAQNDYVRFWHVFNRA